MENNNNINKQLKKLVIMLGLTLIMGGIALVIAYSVKNKFNQQEDNNDTSTLTVDQAISNNFSKSCNPLQIEYKENYIAINSKNCNKLLIINPHTGKYFYKQY